MKAVRELGLMRRETALILSMSGLLDKKHISVYDRIVDMLTSGAPIVLQKAPLGS